MRTVAVAHVLGGGGGLPDRGCVSIRRACGRALQLCFVSGSAKESDQCFWTVSGSADQAHTCTHTASAFLGSECEGHSLGNKSARVCLKTKSEKRH